MKRDPKTHALLLALVGGYMGYIAYQLFQGLQSGSSDMAPWLAIALSAFFALACIGILIYAWKVSREKPEEKEEARDETDLPLKG